MNSKQQKILQLMDDMQASGITLADLEKEIYCRTHTKPKNSISTGNIAVRVFIYLGAILIFSGISTYIHMFWSNMSSFMRIFITLGTGIGLSALALIAMREGKYPRIILPLIIIAACVETTGWFVMIYELLPHGDDTRKAVAFVFGIMAVQQSLIFNLHQRTSLLFTAIFFAYAFLGEMLGISGMKQEYAAILLGGCLIYTSIVISRTEHRQISYIGYLAGAFLFNGGIFRYIELLFDGNWAAIITGISLCSFAYCLKESDDKRWSGPTFFIGSAIFYDGLFGMVYHTPFELLYLAAAIGMIYACTLLESRVLLFTSVIAILGFIGYYTTEYFVNSVGWPIALVLMGIAFLGTGAAAVKVKQKYLL